MSEVETTFFSGCFDFATEVDFCFRSSEVGAKSAGRKQKARELQIEKQPLNDRSDKSTKSGTIRTQHPRIYFDTLIRKINPSTQRHKK
jgi:hypothetical protein